MKVCHYGSDYKTWKQACSFIAMWNCFHGWPLILKVEQQLDGDANTSGNQVKMLSCGTDSVTNTEEL